MNENSILSAKTHNTVLIIITVASIGAVVESITQGWEFWVPPLIICGLITTWVIHAVQYSRVSFRENFYLIFSMVVAFYHGVHETSFFDIIVISVLLMATATLLGRHGFLILLLVEYFVIMSVQLTMALKLHTIAFESMNISRIFLHVIAEICIFRILSELIKGRKSGVEVLERTNEAHAREKEEIQNLIMNISDELKTPVEIINIAAFHMQSKNRDDDVVSVRDAGLKLSNSLQVIQEYCRIQRGDVEVEEDRYRITSVLKNIIFDYGAMDKKSGIELIVDLDPGVPAILKGDVVKIDRILRLLLDNAFRFTIRGGVYLRVTGVKHDYGFNLNIEITDTGVGMDEKDVERIAQGTSRGAMDQVGVIKGMGMGLPIVYGFTRAMKGYVTIDSERGRGTTVRISLAQETVDSAPCLHVDTDQFINIASFMLPGKYRVTRVREFYKYMVTNTAQALRINLYSASSFKELDKLLARGKITHLFLTENEYREAPDFFEKAAAGGLAVSVLASDDFVPAPESRVIILSKPLYGYSVVSILNGHTDLMGVGPDKGGRL